MVMHWQVRLHDYHTISPFRVYSDQIDRPQLLASPFMIHTVMTAMPPLRRGRESNHGVLRLPGYSVGLWDFGRWAVLDGLERS